MKRLKKGIVAWFISLCVLSAIASLFYDTDGEMPPVLGWIIFFASVFLAIRFSKPNGTGKSKEKQESIPKPEPKPVPSGEKPTHNRRSKRTSITPEYIMDRIDSMDGHVFEEFVAELLRDLGYERVKVTPGTNDQGVDVIAVKSGKKYAIQCKRYSNKLGNKPVQEVNAGKAIYGCNVAVVITNSYFTEGGKEAAQALGVLLWDRDELRKMITYVAFKEGWD